MNSSTDELASVVSSLVITCKNAQEGFELAAERVRDFELRAFLGDCGRLRGDMIDDLKVAQRELGMESDTDVDAGSDVASAADGSDGSGHPWMESQAVIADGDDCQMLTQCRRGEELAVAEYRDGIERGLPAELESLVRRQFAVIVATCERLRSLEKNCKTKPR